MKYVTFSGSIAELDESDLAEARIQAKSLYVALGERTISLPNGSITVELLTVPDKDIGSIKATSPIFWRGTCGEGLGQLDPEKINGSITDLKLLIPAVRRAVDQARASLSGSKHASISIETAADILAELGWRFDTSDVQLEADRNLHYIKRQNISVSELKASHAQLSLAISESKQEISRAQNADPGLNGSRLLELDQARLSFCNLRPVMIEDLPTGVQASFRLFNPVCDLDVTASTVEDRSNKSTSIYLSRNRSKRPLSLSSILEALKKAKDR